MYICIHLCVCDYSAYSGFVQVSVLMSAINNIIGEVPPFPSQLITTLIIAPSPPQCLCEYTHNFFRFLVIIDIYIRL